MFEARRNTYAIADRKFKIRETCNLLFELNIYGTHVSLLSIVKVDGFSAIKREPERMKER